MTADRPTTKPIHPSLDGRPVLLGERFVARVDFDEGTQEVEFVLTGVTLVAADVYLSGGDGEEYRLLADEVRRAPTDEAPAASSSDRPTREWVEALLADATPAPWDYTGFAGMCLGDARLAAAAPTLAAELLRVMAAEKVAVDAVEGLLDLAARMRTERNEARRHHREHCSLAEKAMADAERQRAALQEIVSESDEISSYTKSDLADIARAALDGEEHEQECAKAHRPGQPCCPGDDCPACTGEQCWLCGAGVGMLSPRVPCEHDCIDRHDGPLDGKERHG